MSLTPTNFVNAGELTATVPAVPTPGTAMVTVFNPGPGGGISNPVPFTIIDPISNLDFTAVPIPGTTSPINVVTADFNHDGKADLAVIDEAPAPFCNYQNHRIGSIAIFFGNGNGTFTQQPSLCFTDVFAETPRRLVVAGNLNQVGESYLIAVYDNPNDDRDNLDVYLANASGQFSGPYSAGQVNQYAEGLAVGDFGGIGQLMIAESSLDDMEGVDGVFLLGYGDLFGSVAQAAQFSAGPLVAGGFRGNGALDLAEGGSSLTMFQNIGYPTFTIVNEGPFGDGASVVSGDFNADGKLDLATTDGNGISVLFGNGLGGFGSNLQLFTAHPNVSLITTDFNGDGMLDFAVADSTDAVSIWEQNEIQPGTFNVASVNIPIQGNNQVAADLNGDGRMDLVTTNSATGALTAYLQHACADPSQTAPFSGTYNSPVTVTWTNPTAGCVLHFTTNGMHPTASSPIFPRSVSE